MRPLTFFAFAVLGLFCAPEAIHAEPPAYMGGDITQDPSANRAARPSWAEVHDAVVTVLAKGPRGRVKAQGSGVMIRPRWMVTNQHVTSAGGRLRVVGQEGRYWGTLETASAKADFALVRLPPNDFGFLKLGARPRIGQQVFAVGTPRGKAGTVTMGRVQGYQDLGALEVLRTNARTQPGSSGGALINRQAELVGVTSAIDRRTGETIAISTASLVAYLVDQGFLDPSGVPKGAPPSTAKVNWDRILLTAFMGLPSALLFWGLVFGLGRLSLGPGRPRFSFTMAFVFVWGVTSLALLIALPEKPSEAPGASMAVPLVAAVAALLFIRSRSGATGAGGGQGGQAPAKLGSLPGQEVSGSTSKATETGAAPRVVVRPRSGGGFILWDREAGRVLENVDEQEEAVWRASRRNQTGPQKAENLGPAGGEEDGEVLDLIHRIRDEEEKTRRGKSSLAFSGPRKSFAEAFEDRLKAGAFLAVVMGGVAALVWGANQGPEAAISKGIGTGLAAFILGFLLGSNLPGVPVGKEDRRG